CKELAIIIVKLCVGVDEVHVFEAFVCVGFQLEAAHGGGEDVDQLVCGVSHGGQGDAGDDVRAVLVVFGAQLLESAAQVVKGQESLVLGAQMQFSAHTLAVLEEDHHGYHAVGLHQLGQIQAIAAQAVDGKTGGVGFFFEEKQKS